MFDRVEDLAEKMVIARSVKDQKHRSKIQRELINQTTSHEEFFARKAHVSG